MLIVVTADETIVTFFAQEGSLTLRAAGGYEVPQFLEQITVLGAKAEPKSVTLSGEEVSSTSEWDDRIGRVLVTGLSVKLDGEKVVAW
jgi:hypothetical protein